MSTSQIISSARPVRLVLMALMALSLSACAETQFLAAKWKDYKGPSGQQGYFKVGKPYTVDGRTYRPSESYSLDETGVASWYGPGFHASKTANGERFSQDELTAAHRTLQLPALVRVTNLENGRSLVVRVNDRGPFSRGRIIDVSKKAADLLGFKNKGTARVRLQVLAEESRQMADAARRGEDTRGRELALNNLPPEQQLAYGNPSSFTGPSSSSVPITMTDAPTSVAMTAGEQGVAPDIMAAGYTEPQVISAPLPSSNTVYTPSGVQGRVASSGAFYPDPVVKQFPVTPNALYVQTGSFSNPENANRVVTSLHGLGPVRVKSVLVGNTTFYRVQVGPVQDVAVADRLLSQTINRGYPDARIMVDDNL